MSEYAFVGPVVFTWVIIPVLIFFARICDVSLGTMRILSIGRGNKLVAPLLGFLEVLIWLLAIRQIMQNLTNVFYYFVYSGGFAAGTFMGMYIEEKLAVGVRSIRIITRKDASRLIEWLRKTNHGVTVLNAEGATGEVNVIYTVVNRGDIENVIKTINRFNPNAFYTIEDIRSAREGVFPKGMFFSGRTYLDLLRSRRKGK
jgi:uncharacterized protein YebE (UPF0316 family)